MWSPVWPPHSAMRCHLIVGANRPHKPATLTRHTHGVPTGDTARSQYSHILPCLLLEYNSEQYRQDIVSLSSFSIFFFFDDFSVCSFPLFFEPVGCRHVTRPTEALAHMEAGDRVFETSLDYPGSVRWHYLSGPQLFLGN